MQVELKQLSKRIWYLPSTEETDRPVLTYIKGEKLSLAVDAGNSPAHIGLFYDELSKNGLRLPDLTVITHWHWDHTFALCAVHGVSMACKKTNDQLRKVKQWSWNDEAMKKRLQMGEDIAFCDTCIRLEYPDLHRIIVRHADVEFDGEMIIDLGGVTCRLIARDAPHSRDQVLVYVPEENLLVGGDGCGEDFYNHDGIYEKDRLAAYIDALEAIPFETYIGGHDDPETRENIMSYMKDELSQI